ncbi:uncharacterized protein LOC119464990 isoform X2 [Dermacentor silvarum]|uniref:uncharacterized protein LOC119464990 isoform X2 n=1 Tax=Dermacentor silvarum TaxID=543639 RepID=UPI0018987B84|nr:uncharacterized protein LOC119464990 isoform X2 [Dermacentor silvarum]
MFALPLIICMLAVANAARTSKLDYAEDPAHYPEQKLSEMAAVNETLFVHKRNYKTNTTLRCLSATKLENPGGDSYKYRLKARIGASSHYINYTVIVIANQTGEHPEPNAAFYQEDPMEKSMNHKIVTMDERRTCFVLVRETGNDAKGKYRNIVVHYTSLVVVSPSQFVHLRYKEK